MRAIALCTFLGVVVLSACAPLTVTTPMPGALNFFSREESRMHVHVSHPDGEAKFWLEPSVALARHTDEYGYRLRVGNYRVFFEFDGAVRIVSIEEVRRRDGRTY